jgi:hypothetical protein
VADRTDELGELAARYADLGVQALDQLGPAGVCERFD